ncbi:hypothetical protein M5689_013743 [Euphorbia peplus]|nr:hypothetical protein M5689_013741 [Euphorbia peplus]WCJ32309.1 hypothetical protein M5689_013743 [Euphorbia peplus]
MASSFVGSISSMPTRIPNLFNSKPSNKRPLLIKSAAKRDRSKSSSGGGAQINVVSRSSGMLLRSTFDLRAELITSHTNLSSVDDSTDKTQLIVDGDDSTIFKAESTLDN